MNSITVLITPGVAERWLEKNIKNRILKTSKVAKLVREMKSGQWIEETGESIKFLGDFEQLIDGQHRLAAIVESGLSFEFLVNINCSEKAFSVIDTGSTRTARDLVSIQGFKKYSGEISSGVSRFLLIKSKSKHWNNETRPTNHMVLEATEKLSEKYNLEEIASASVALRGRSVGVINSSYLFAIALIFCECGFSFEVVRLSLNTIGKENPFIMYLQTKKLKGLKTTAPEMSDIIFTMIADFLSGRQRERITSLSFRDGTNETIKKLNL